MSPSHPWDQLPDEPARAYELFAAYLHAGPSRSIAAAARLSGHSDSNLRRYASRFDWKARAEAHDREALGRVVERRSGEREDEEMDQLRAFAEESLERYERLGTASDSLVSLAIQTLDRMLAEEDDLDPRLLCTALNTAAALASAACDLKARVLGVDEMLAVLQADPDRDDS
jgi:hypothetical protein